MPLAPKDHRAELDAPLDEVVRNFPTILDKLRTSYEELEQRAGRVERELFSTNRELEERLRELDGLRSHLEAVLESLPCGVVVRDADDAIVAVNAAAQELLCLSAEELVSTDGRLCLEGHAALQGAAADGEPHEVRCDDGRRLVLASSYSQVRRRDGVIDGSVEILDDRTERVRMTERLHATDKMAALGTMAAGIAHEIRNPMNAVKGFAALLVRRSDFDEKARRWCQLIVEATSEADAIIENMLSFGSPERLRLESIEGADLLATAAGLARGDRDSNAVRIDTSASAPAFLGDHIKLRQAVRNLIVNAIDAQLAGDENEADVHVDLSADEETIRICVDDAGPGVSEEIRSRIFDPFFTDHPDGTGLGLALVSTIVRLHDGSVRLSSEASPLGGARFVIRFPYRAVDSPITLETARSAQ